MVLSVLRGEYKTVFIRLRLVGLRRTGLCLKNKKPAINNNNPAIVMAGLNVVFFSVTSVAKFFSAPSAFSAVNSFYSFFD